MLCGKCPCCRFVDDHEETEGDLVLEQLINRMIKALTKTQAQVLGAQGPNSFRA